MPRQNSVLSYRLNALLFFSLVVATSGQALTLSEAVHKRWQTSPSLSGQQDQVAIASHDRWRRFVPNEPQFNYTNTDDGTGESYGLSLTVPIPIKPFALSELDGARAAVQRAELRAKRHELARDTIQAYVDCAIAMAAVRQQELSITDNETLARSLRARYEAGTATQAENIGMELQIRQMRADVETTRDHSVVACRKSAQLLGEPAEQLTYELPRDLEQDLVNELGEETPDEARAVAALRLAKANRSAAWWSQLPDITFSATRNHYSYLPGSPSGKELTWTYGAAVTLPLLFFTHETVEGSRGASQAEIDRGTAEAQLIGARSDREDARREYRRDQTRLDELQRKDLPMAEALRESTLSAYRTGKLGFAEIVFARKTLADLQASVLQLRSALINAHLRCLNTCGETRQPKEPAS